MKLYVRFIKRNEVADLQLNEPDSAPPTTSSARFNISLLITPAPTDIEKRNKKKEEIDITGEVSTTNKRTLAQIRCMRGIEQVDI